MEWRKVRGWLLILLLAVNLILAGNLVVQVLKAEQTLRDAARNAVELASARGLELELEAVLELPRQLEAYTAQRSDELESGAAAALLGGSAGREASGGGVAIYESEAGVVSFRRGGSVEADAPWTRESFDAVQCTTVLENAGLPMKKVQRQETDGVVQLSQYHGGYPVFNGRLECALEEDRLKIRGQWLLAAELSEAGTSLSRAQMVMELCELAENLGLTQVKNLQAGYYIQSDAPQSLTLVPVWCADTDQGSVIISCVSGEQILY